MKKTISLCSLLFLIACAPVEREEPADPMAGMDHGSMASHESSMDDDRLNESPRHHEWVQVQNGERVVHTWVVYPERSDAAPAVLVIHENRGLNDWARGFADQIAEQGYIAVAPDLLSGFSDEYQKTSDFPDEDAARDALYELDPNQVQSDLAAVAEYAKSIDAANGKLATAGFCWGGSQSFEMATRSSEPDIAMVFYGTSPEETDAYANIDMPVYAFYGGDDERVNSTIDRADEAMTQANKTFEYEVYEGAGHAFMRSGEDPSGSEANVAARNQAWERLQTILSELE